MNLAGMALALDRCRKCGAGAESRSQYNFVTVNPLSARFCKGGPACRAGNPPAGEHLDVTCDHCGWVGIMRCLDDQPEVP